METLIKESLKDFSVLCASDSPTPGGGSVAAYCASLAAALGQMVIALTIGKKAYAELSPDLQQKIVGNASILARLRGRLLEFVDEDTQAFNEFMKALRMSKDTEEAKTRRKSAMNEAAIRSMTVPLGTAKACIEVLRCLPDIAQYGNANAVTDAGVASLLARAATESALFNVRINLTSVDNESLCEEARQQCSSLLAEAENLNKEIVQIVYERI